MSPDKSPTSKSKEPAATTAKRKAADLADQARDAAGKAAKDVTQTAKTHADDAKSAVADEMSGVASALRTAAEEMPNGSPQERTFGQIAEALADASDSVRNKDLRTMVRDVTGFARNNPLVFLGGAALIGFAATRFAKASADGAPDHAGQAPRTSARGDFS